MSAPPPAPRLLIRLAFAALVLQLALVAIGASTGPRGSDQFWYVAEVDALVQGRGATINQVWPRSAFAGVPELPRPAMHNILPTYIAAPAAALLGPHAGWVVTNTVCSALAALAIGLAAATLGAGPWAPVLAILWLLLPLTLWETMQPLVEAPIAALIALLVALVVSADERPGRWLAAAVVTGLLTWSRESYMALVPVIGGLYLLRTRRPSALPLAGAMVAIPAVFVIARGALFPGNIEQAMPLLSVARMKLPGVTTGMYSFFALEPSTITASEAVAKVLHHAVQLQFLSLDSAGILFFGPVNLLMLGALLALVRLLRPGGEGSLLDRLDTPAGSAVLLAVAFIGIHFLSAVISQNQFRYGLNLTPPLLAACVVLLPRLSERRLVAVVAAIAVIGGGLGAVLTRRIHREGREATAVVAQLDRFFDAHTAPGDRIVLGWQDIEFQARMARAGEPRTFLVVPEGYTPAQYRTMADNVGATWVIAASTSEVPAALGVTAGGIALPAPHEDARLYPRE